MPDPSMWTQRRWLPVALAGATLMGGATARAADTREAREREARKACFTGNVDRGVEILVDLYGETDQDLDAAVDVTGEARLARLALPRLARIRRPGGRPTHQRRARQSYG